MSNSLSSLSTRFEKLNPEQRMAVDTLEGPVMVIAGPGTGKTETLGARIANILEKTDSLPQQILCLTYTTAGVVAMRKRLLEFIGPDAQKVEIHTFHSFCNKVIQENPEIFSNARDEENISELEQHEIIDGLLDALPTNHSFFSHNSTYYWSSKLLQLFSTLKSEKWTPEVVRTKVQEYLDFLPENPEYHYKRKTTNKKTGEVFQKGDINPVKIEKEEAKMQKLLSGVELFEQYSAEMLKRGKYDFNDMILWVLEKFSNNEGLLLEYQEQFQYILVDEFQDTNGSQKQLIDQLISYWENPNIFVVGDDDQSIYRFQGANMRNILEFANEQKNIQTITLTRNYRSTQEILDIAETVIARNSERLVSEISGLSKHLTAEHPERKNNPIKPRLTGYYNEIHEQLGVFKKLKALHKRGDNLSNTAVIYKNHKQAKNIIDLCEREKIPVRVKENQNILDLPLFHFIRHLLEYFKAEQKIPFSGESLLYKIMYFPFWNISQQDIALVTLELRKNNSEKRRLSKDGNADVLPEICHLKTLLLELGDNTQKGRMQYVPTEDAVGECCIRPMEENLQNPESLKNFSEIILQLENYAQTKPLTSFIEHLLYDTKIMEWVFLQEEKPYLMRIISTFFGFVRDEHQKNSRLTLSNILEIFEKMERHNLSLPIQKILYEKEGIHFITAHSSKGLEFDNVFVIGVNKNTWDKPRKTDVISFPNTLTLSNEGDELEEARRLFFVAITRAKKFLEISYSERNLNGKELDPSTFISETPLEAESKMYEEEEILQYQRALFQPLESEKISLLDEKYLQDILENYSLSPTHLNKYLACPRAFYFENFLRIPKAMVSPMAFGNAVHRALEFALQEYRKNIESSGETNCNSSLLDMQKISDVFEQELVKYTYLFAENELQKKMVYGKEVIQKFLENPLSIWEKESSAEYSVRTAVDGTPINGKLDAVHFLDQNEVRVVDYKTGKFSHAKDRLLPPCEKNENQGGDYWRQLVFYKILLQNDMRKPWVMQEGSMSFVESGEEKVISPSETDVEIVKAQISDTYQKISNFEFSHGCEECEWCEFWRKVV